MEITHCEFHVEKTPSCVLYHEKDRFHCLSCGEEGDIYAIQRRQKTKAILCELICGKYFDEGRL